MRHPEEMKKARYEAERALLLAKESSCMGARRVSCVYWRAIIDTMDWAQGIKADYFDANSFAASSMGLPPVQQDNRIRKCVQECTKCPVSGHINKKVYGFGSPHSDLMVIGEGPGRTEDEQGLPFVGKSGEILDRIMYHYLQRQRGQYYVTNIVKCRVALPDQKDRAPNDEEIKACIHFLEEQIEIVRPEVILTVGKVAGCAITGQVDAKMYTLRGKVFRYNRTPVVCTFHPAYVARNEDDAKVWGDVAQDLQLVAKILSNPEDQLDKIT